MKRYDPIFGNKKPSFDKRDLVSIANSEEVIAGAPVSPISNRPMQIVKGANEGKTFKMWVNLEDRIALPYHE